MGIVEFRAIWYVKLMEKKHDWNKVEIIKTRGPNINLQDCHLVVFLCVDMEDIISFIININIALFVTVPSSVHFPILPLISLFNHTRLSLQQALTATFAFLLWSELQDTQTTQRCIYGICIIHEVKITRYLDERQLDNYS